MFGHTGTQWSGSMFRVIQLTIERIKFINKYVCLKTFTNKNYTSTHQSTSRVQCMYSTNLLLWWLMEGIYIPTEYTQHLCARMLSICMYVSCNIALRNSCPCILLHIHVTILIRILVLLARFLSAPVYLFPLLVLSI